MKVALLHTFYQQPGGEDAVFRDEVALLRKHGHEVMEITAHNQAMDDLSTRDRVKVTLSNSAAAEEVIRTLRDTRPEVLHVHNTFQYWSPEVFWAAKQSGVPTVWTLHNYRVLCANGLFFRNGHICELCLGRRFQWPGIRYRCYRGDAKASAVVALMNARHWKKGTWTEAIDAMICLTDFAKGKFIEGGLPAAKLHVKPNFVDPDPGPGDHQDATALFVGRLDAYKGIRTLLRAWEFVAGLNLTIIGDGDLRPEVEAIRSPHIKYLGPQPADRVIEEMKRSKLLVFTSELYEGFPRVIVEAFATGLPVVVSDCGSAATVVESDKTGVHFRTGDAVDLADRVNELAAAPEKLAALSEAARRTYLDHYTGDANAAMLEAIYRSVSRLSG
ncbi:MAG: D-inositol-3-phosphate glycosyltransferase [Fimbriimonadaceae bacterium]|nr:D-inositol-3-phosphate glycosyltransferase [Fimbriimonadaceae bacterium]